VESLRVQGPGTPYGVYRPVPSQAPSLYASCDAALVRYILGDLDLSPLQRRQWDDPEAAKRWMEGLSWQSPWEPSIQVLHVAAPRGAAAAMDRKGRRAEAELLRGVRARGDHVLPRLTSGQGRRRRRG
jgi:hypothetical protein